MEDKNIGHTNQLSVLDDLFHCDLHDGYNSGAYNFYKIWQCDMKQSKFKVLQNTIIL